MIIDGTFWLYKMFVRFKSLDWNYVEVWKEIVDDK